MKVVDIDGILHQVSVVRVQRALRLDEPNKLWRDEGGRGVWKVVCMREPWFEDYESIEGEATCLACIAAAVPQPMEPA